MANTNSSAEVGAFFAGVLVGGLVGAAIALLMAPQSGVETRQQLGRASHDLRDRAHDTLEDARERAEATIADARRRAERIIEEARERAEHIIKEARGAADQAARDAKSAVERAVPSSGEA
jgi:gas vesicle protein